VFSVNVSKTIPQTPLNLHATAGDSQVTLNWDAVAIADAYVLYRTELSGTGYARIKETNQTNYIDLGLINGRTYYYTVSAKNANGESSMSSEVNATPSGSALNHPPIARLAVSALNIMIGQSIKYNGNSSSDPDAGDSVSEYNFNFGDASVTGWIKSGYIVHSYSNNGTFIATLTVRDTKGLSSTPTNVTIHVYKLTDAPDLKIVSINITVAEPHDDENVTVYATILNAGKTDLTNIGVGFYCDRVIMEKVVIGSLLKNHAASVMFNWTAVEGNHTLKVSADPDNMISEKNESNNIDC
jgi:hypothetical protein